MTPNVEAITSYDFKASDELLLDTNVWLFVYGPQSPGNSKVEVYSKAFNKILTARCRIYIDVLIVSEFINTYARLQWRLVAPDVNDFKTFRKSREFKPVAQAIASDVKRVFRHCARVENSFAVLDINDLIDDYAVGNFDFNDQILADLCKKKGLKLVTDDGDFKSQGVPVITANMRLLV